MRRWGLASRPRRAGLRLGEPVTGDGAGWGRFDAAVRSYIAEFAAASAQVELNSSRDPSGLSEEIGTCGR